MGLYGASLTRGNEFRASSPYTTAFMNGDEMPNAWGLGGVAVDGMQSLQVATVFSCARVRAEDISTLPLILYRRLPRGGKERATDHPLYPLLHNDPNDEMTGVSWLQASSVYLDLRGNAFSQIVRNGYGEPLALIPLLAERMKIARDEMGRLVYRYRKENGELRTFQQDEILHFRGLTANGILGMSPVEMAGGPLLVALNAERFGISFFANGSHPGGVITTNGTITTDGAAQLKADFEGPHMGVQNANRVAVLEDGTTFTPFTIPPEDAQFLETRNYERSEIAGMFRMPPHKIGDLSHATYSNVEEMNIDWVVSGLRPALVSIEREVGRQLKLGTDYFVEFLVDGLLRGNAYARAQALQIQRQNGALNGDEWREIENRNPIEDEKGQQFWMPSNMEVVGQERPMARPSTNQSPNGQARHLVGAA